VLGKRRGSLERKKSLGKGRKNTCKAAKSFIRAAMPTDFVTSRSKDFRVYREAFLSLS